MSSMANMNKKLKCRKLIMIRYTNLKKKNLLHIENYYVLIGSSSFIGRSFIIFSVRKNPDDANCY